MTESDLWKSTREGINDPQVHWTRIENTVGTGQSDVHGLLSGVDAWIELKIFHGNQIDFRKSEVAWITRRTECGGRTWILARKKDTLLLYPGVALETLIHNGVATIEGVRKGTLRKPLTIEHWAFAYRLPFDWQDLKNRIFLSEPRLS